MKKNTDMVSVEDLESWVFEYSAKNRFYDVISELCSRDRNLPSRIQDIWLILAAMCRIVDFWEVDNFELAIEMIEFVYSTVPKCVEFKIFSKLTTGLKMRLLLHQLRAGREDVLERLFCFFPRTSSDYSDENQLHVKKHRKAHSCFRKQFLTLLAHENQRNDYFRREHDEKYGDNWVAAVRLLMNMFCDQVTKHLPLTMIEKVLRDGLEQHISTQQFTTLATEMFVEILDERQPVNSKDLLDFLKMLQPRNTQSPVQFLHHLNLTNSCSIEEQMELSGSLNSISTLLTSSSDVNVKNGRNQQDATEENLINCDPSLQKDIDKNSPSNFDLNELKNGDDRTGSLRKKGSGCKMNSKCEKLFCLNRKIWTNPSHCVIGASRRSQEIVSPDERGDDWEEQSSGKENLIDPDSQDQVCVVSSSSDQSKCTPSPGDVGEMEVTAESNKLFESKKLEEKTLLSGEMVENDLESDLEIWKEEDDLHVYENTRKNSVSDIDAVLSDEEVPSSKHGESDYLSCEDECPPVPDINAHVQMTPTRLCVIKLYQSKELTFHGQTIFT